MALIANTLPLNLSTVKTAYGAAGNELRDYIPGGGINGHVIKPTGMMETGTVKLSDFLGTTRINFGDRVGAGQITPNTTIVIRSVCASQSPSVSFSESGLGFAANTGTFKNTAGQLLVTCWTDGTDVTENLCNLTYNVGTSGGGTYVANAWLLGASGGSTNSVFDVGLFDGWLDVLWNPTANSGTGTSLREAVGILTGNANVWVNITGDIAGMFAVRCSAERDTTLGTSTATYSGYLAFRMNTSPQTVLANTFISLYASAGKFA